MRNSIWNKRIPSLLGILMLLVGVGLTSYLLQFKTIFTSRAAPGNTPQDVRISNITESSFTVSFKTTDKVNASISYGSDQKFGKVSLDDRDKQSGTPQAYTLHYITVTGLSENQNYVFSIISGVNTYLKDSSPYTVTTSKKLTQNPSTQLPLVGTILTSTGDPAKDSIVYVTTTGSEVLSTITKDDGSYVIPLNALRSSDLSTYIPLSEASTLKILAFSSTEVSHISVLANQTNPVPPAMLSKDYDFTLNPTLPIAPVASTSASEKSDFPSFSTKEVSAGTPTILSPKKEEEFSDTQPTFTGTGVANQSISVEIHSETVIKDTIKADSQGNWKYRPKQPLAPGNHTITIVTKDAKGLIKTLTQSFVVYAEGSKSTQPSVSPTKPTATPSPTPTRVPTQIPTATPTIVTTTVPTPTLIPTTIVVTPTIFVPTSTPTPTIIRAVTPLPATGSSSGIALTIFGVVLVGVGMILFALTQKSI